MPGTDVYIYPRAPHNPSDVILAGASGPGSSQSLLATATGSSTVTMGMGAQRAVLANPAGVGHVVENLGSSAQLAITVLSVAHVTAYLGTPIRLTATANGVGQLTEYLAGPIPLAAASHGVGTIAAYLATPLGLSWSSAGRAAFTSNYVSSHAFPVWAATHGVGTAAIYLSGPTGPAWVAHGVATDSRYLSGPLPATLQVAAGVGSMQARLVGPVYPQVAAHGVGAVFEDLYGFYQRWTAHAGASGLQWNLLRGRGMAIRPRGDGEMTIEIQGVPALRIRPAGVGSATWSLPVTKFSRFTINSGTRAYSLDGGFHFLPAMTWTLYQEHAWQADGVGSVSLRPTSVFHLPISSHGVGSMVISGPPSIRWKTETNLEHYNRTFAETSGLFPTFIYPPDLWHLTVNWALRFRSRGRTRFRWDAVFGDLLQRLFAIPQPWEPNIDSNSANSAFVGQFWPRQKKLPFQNLDPATHPEEWVDYEYARR